MYPAWPTYSLGTWKTAISLSQWFVLDGGWRAPFEHVNPLSLMIPPHYLNSIIPKSSLSMVWQSRPLATIPNQGVNINNADLSLMDTRKSLGVEEKSSKLAMSTFFTWMGSQSSITNLWSGGSRGEKCVGSGKRGSKGEKCVGSGKRREEWIYWHGPENRLSTDAHFELLLHILLHLKSMSQWARRRSTTIRHNNSRLLFIASTIILWIVMVMSRTYNQPHKWH